MRTRLHILANQNGTYEGLNAQYNGAGFSDMHFIVKVVDPRKLEQWANSIKHGPNTLTRRNYQQLLKPTIGNKKEYYSSVTPGLFKEIIQSYKVIGGVSQAHSDHIQPKDSP